MGDTVKRGAWIWVASTLIFFQSSDVSLRLASVQTHFAVGTVLQAMPLMLVAIAAAVRHRLLQPKDGPAPRAWLAAAGYGFLQFFAGNVLFYAAVQQGGLSIASPSVQSQAIWAVLIGGALLGERISRTMVGGIGLFVVGLGALSWFKSAGTSLEDGWMWAFVFGLAGGLSWAGASAVQSSLLRKGMPLVYILAVGSATGVVLLNVFIAFRYGMSVWTNTDPNGAWKVLAAGCFNGLAVLSISQALKSLPVSKVIPVISLSIVFNTIIGKLAFGEYVNFGSAVGMLLAFAGVVLVQEPKLLRGRSAGRAAAATEQTRSNM